MRVTTALAAKQLDRFQELQKVVLQAVDQVATEYYSCYTVLVLSPLLLLLLLILLSPLQA